MYLLWEAGKTRIYETNLMIDYYMKIILYTDYIHWFCPFSQSRQS